MKRFLPVIVALFTVASSYAQTKTDEVAMAGRFETMPNINPKQQGANDFDRTNLAMLTYLIRFNILISQRAAEVASNPATKTYAARAISDGKFHLDELLKLSAKEDVVLLGGVTENMTKAVNTVKNLPTAEIDKGFLKFEEQWQNVMINLLVNGISKGYDADVRGYFVKVLPVVIERQRIVQAELAKV